MDALDLLEQQHRDVIALIDLIAAEASPGRRTAMVGELSRHVDAHVRVEETCFYPVCAERMNGDRRPLHEAFERHALLRFAADQLLRTRATDVCFDARLRLVRDLFAQHADAEEDWMLPKAKRDLTDEQLDVLGGELERAYALLLRLEGAPAARRAPTARRAAPRRGAGVRRTPRAVAARRVEGRAARS